MGEREFAQSYGRLLMSSTDKELKKQAARLLVDRGVAVVGLELALSIPQHSSEIEDILTFVSASTFPDSSEVIPAQRSQEHLSLPYLISLQRRSREGSAHW